MIRTAALLVLLSILGWSMWYFATKGQTAESTTIQAPAPAPAPASIPFVIGAPLGENDSPVWVMMARQYGNGSSSNCQISFYDVQREEIVREWLDKHPGTPFAPPGLVGDLRKDFDIPEADPFGRLPNFEWRPIDPDHQHYSVGIHCHEGDLGEDWQVARIRGVLLTKIKLERKFPLEHRSQELYSCADALFPSSFPRATLKTWKGPNSTVNPGWKPNHLVVFPTVIYDYNHNIEAMTVKTPGCWKCLVQYCDGT
jgi:hypothetical protein